MRLRLFIVSLFFTLPALGQQQGFGLDQKKWLITGSLSLGQNTRNRFSDTSAWLQIGRDTTNRGLLLPRIVSTDSVYSPKSGLLVYSIPDSSLKVYIRGVWRTISLDAIIDTTDEDAAAFINAITGEGGSLDATQRAAIQGLVYQLKYYSLWTKMKAIYPFIGGTAAAHKWNLKDPRDLDSAYRLTFTGSWTHSSTGALPDASTAYANTYLNPANVLTASSGSMGYYSRTSSAGATGVAAYDMGVATSGDTRATIVICRYHNDRSYLNYGTATYPYVSSTDGRGFFVVSRNDGTTTKGYKNGTESLTSVDGVSNPSAAIYIGACNRAGTATYFGNKQCAFAFVGTGLSGTDATNLNTAVLAFETALSRNVP